MFGIAAAIAFATVALAGVAYGMFSTFNPTIGTDQLQLFAFAAVVIGGHGGPGDLAVGADPDGRGQDPPGWPHLRPAGVVGWRKKTRPSRAA